MEKSARNALFIRSYTCRMHTIYSDNEQKIKQDIVELLLTDSITSARMIYRRDCPNDRKIKKKNRGYFEKGERGHD